MPHYHRRYSVSLLSSAWGQVVPLRYCRQAKSSIQKADVNNDFASFFVLNLLQALQKHFLGVVWLSLTGN